MCTICFTGLVMFFVVVNGSWIEDICKYLEGRDYILFLSVSPSLSTVSGMCIDTKQ